MNKRDVVLLILSHGDKILLQKRSREAERFPGTWGLFGGGVHSDESSLEAICRELREELNYEVRDPKFVKSFPYEISKTKESGQVHVFTEEYDGESLELAEGEALGWYDKNEIEKLEIDPLYRMILTEIVFQQNPMIS